MAAAGESCSDCTDSPDRDPGDGELPSDGLDGEVVASLSGAADDGFLHAHDVVATSLGAGVPRAVAWGGVVGPVAFLGAWVVGGATRTGYDPVRQAISQLAAVGASSRPLMTAGFVVFGLAVASYALALRTAMPGHAWLAALATGSATLGVAAVPLGRSPAADAVHGWLAVGGYLALVALPVLGARNFAARGARAAAGLSMGAGLVAAVALALSSWGATTGFFQRLGLTTGHAWVAATAVALIAGRLPGRRRARGGNQVPTSRT